MSTATGYIGNINLTLDVELWLRGAVGFANKLRLATVATRQYAIKILCQLHSCLITTMIWKNNKEKNLREPRVLRGEKNKRVKNAN